MSVLLTIIAASSLSFSCEIDRPRNAIISQEGVTSKVIGLPPELNQWRFDLTLTEQRDSLDVKLDWPGDPITAGKAVAAFPIGPHDYTFISLHPGPCLFTQTSCLTMYTLSVQPNSTAEILIQPSAIGSDGEWSKPFQAFMTGRCTPKKAAA